MAVKHVPCPHCGKAAPFTPENRWRPFCSERCKVIDLGDWAAERYRVPVQEEKGSEQISDESADAGDDAARGARRQHGK